MSRYLSAATTPAPKRSRARSRGTLAAVALALCAGLGGEAAHATEGGASLFIPGMHGPLAGFVPPPGFYFESDLYSYSGKLSASMRTQIGGTVLGQVRLEARAGFLTPTWVTPVEILGGNLAFAATVPLGVPRVSADAVIAAPRLGRTIGLGARDAAFNLGDPVFTTLIGWHSGKFHWSTSAAVNVPVGTYQDGQLSNLALHRWIGDLSASITHLDTDTGLDISSTVGIELNGKNDATDYKSGNALHGDLAITQNFSKAFSIGAQISHYQQITADSGSGASVGGHKGRVTAVGGSVGYNFEAGGVPIQTRLKLLREVAVENRTRGTIAILSIAIPLGGQAPSAQPKSAILKH